MKTIIKRYPLSCLETLAIWVVCLIPVPETPLNDISMIDKWTHFVMYGSLVVVMWIEHIYNIHKKRTSARLTIRFWSAVLLWPIAMGGLIELAQAYLTTCRSGDFFDFLCNTLGVLLGTLLSLVIFFLSKGRK